MTATMPYASSDGLMVPSLSAKDHRPGWATATYSPPFLVNSFTPSQDL